jgi:hypothetical protein
VNGCGPAQTGLRRRACDAAGWGGRGPAKAAAVEHCDAMWAALVSAGPGTGTGAMAGWAQSRAAGIGYGPGCCPLELSSSHALMA